MNPREDLIDDFMEFSRLHLESNDIDPLYPVLEHVARDIEPAERIAFTLVYVAFYNLPSAFFWWHRGQHTVGEARLAAARAPTGTERRALRGGHNMLRHLAALDALAERHGSFEAWLKHRFTGDPAKDWKVLQQTLQEAWGNGRWASYKTAELLLRNHGFPVEPSDMGNEGSTGPRKGLELLYGKQEGPGAVERLDAFGAHLHDLMKGRGLALDLAQVETCVCDFYSATQGRYYIGHDIDGLQEQIEGHPLLADEEKARLMHARSEVLDPAYLGERQWWGGWHGVDKERNKEYARTKRILWRG